MAMIHPTAVIESGAVIDDGTPKYDRNHMLAPSRSSRGASLMRVILPGGFPARAAAAVRD